MDAAIKALLGLGIDVSLSDQAPEGGLYMGAGAAEAIVKVEVSEGCVEIVPPQEADNPTAKPDALRIAGRAGQGSRSFGNLIDFFLAFFGRFGGRLLWFGGLTVTATLRKGRKSEA